MLVFIDESGDSGMSSSPSSSPHLVVTLVLFDDRSRAQAADDRVSLLRGEMGLHPGFEFHFSKLRREWRERFLRELSAFDFFHFSVVMHKAELNRFGVRSAAEFYRYACGLVFQCAKPYLRDATVVMDGTGSGRFRRELGAYLRRQTNAPDDEHAAIRKVKLQDSRRNNLLQLADMVCGSVARSLSDKPDAPRYRRLVSHREVEVVHFPK